MVLNGRKIINDYLKMAWKKMAVAYLKTLYYCNNVHLQCQQILFYR
jgi:hypothetical protein